MTVYCTYTALLFTTYMLHRLTFGLPCQLPNTQRTESITKWTCWAVIQLKVTEKSSWCNRLVSLTPLVAMDINTQQIVCVALRALVRSDWETFSRHQSVYTNARYIVTRLSTWWGPFLTDTDCCSRPWHCSLRSTVARTTRRWDHCLSWTCTASQWQCVYTTVDF